MKRDCPEEEILVDHIERRLFGKDRAMMEKHLSNCEECLERAILAKGLSRQTNGLRLETVPQGVTDRTVQLVTSRYNKRYKTSSGKLGQAIQDTFSKIGEVLKAKRWRLLQPATLRSSQARASDDFVCIAVQFKEVEAEIEIEKMENRSAKVRVTPINNKTHERSIRITLKAGERDFASYLLEGSHVTFEDIPFGHYSISLALDNTPSGTYLFEIKDSQDEKR
jgi:hypothetical protein